LGAGRHRTRLGVGLPAFSRRGSPGGEVRCSSAAAAIRYLIRVPSYHLLLAKQILAEAITWVFFGWLPLYLLETYHLKLGAAAFFGTTMLQATLVVGIAFGGWFSDRVAAGGTGRRMLALGGWYVAAAPFPLVFLGHPGMAVVAMAVSACSLCRGLGTANERPIVCEIIPLSFRSTAYGVMNTCATASGAVGVLVAGLLKRHLGLNAIFAAASIFFLLTGLALLLAYTTFMPRDLERCRSHDAESPSAA
jgi:MFS family permease